MPLCWQAVTMGMGVLKLLQISRSTQAPQTVKSFGKRSGRTLCIGRNGNGILRRLCISTLPCRLRLALSLAIIGARVTQ